MKLRQGGWDALDGDSPVAPVMLGRVETAMKMAERLRESGVLAGMVRPPTVPEGTSRLRFSLKPALGFEVIAEQILELLGVSET